MEDFGDIARTLIAGKGFHGVFLLLEIRNNTAVPRKSIIVYGIVSIVANVCRTSYISIASR
jgi:hypothetical protein